MDREGACRVLVVDDDAAITRLVSRALGARHEVTECNDGAQAFERLAHGERYDIILCDLAMPGLRGDEFYRAVNEIDPDLADRIVFMTGGASENAGAAFLSDFSESRYLTKPFHLDRLRAIVAELVGVSGRWTSAAPDSASAPCDDLDAQPPVEPQAESERSHDSSVRHRSS